MVPRNLHDYRHSSEIIVIIGEIADNQGIIDTWRAIIPPSSEVMGMSAGASFMLTETGRAIVVLAHGIKKWLDRREEEFRNKLLEEGREEGRDEERKAWLDWLSRKANAESRGENFTEPPPTRE